jgi:hypothetical protein
MNGNGPITSLVDVTKTWIKQPFTTQMDLVHWFLIVGVVLISAVLWTRVLAHFRE